MDRIGLICRYIKEDPRSTQRDLAQKTGFSVGTVNTFVPIQYMPDGIVHIARFLPIYWFETVNDLLAKHADISGHIQSQILRGMGMELLFFIVLISCSMAVAKYQQQEG